MRIITFLFLVFTSLILLSGCTKPSPVVNTSVHESQIMSEEINSEQAKSFLENLNKLPNKAKIQPLENYRVQIFSKKSDDGNIFLEGNFFCNNKPDWREKRVEVLDGGNCFFTVLFNPESKEFSEMIINGEA